MERYIGLDVHAQSCTMAVMGPSGRRLSERVLETNGQVLVEAIKGIAGKRHLCVEEGTQSQWLYELLEPHVDELAVVQALKRQGNKSDSIDAWKLAEQIRSRSWDKRVYKSTQRFRALREAVRGHLCAVQDLVRAKNRVKAVFRSRGVAVDDEVYETEHREALLRKLPAAQRRLAGHLAEHLDATIASHEKAEQWLKEEGSKLTEVARLTKLPGIGAIRAAQIVAVVITPERFRTKQQFWSYSRLGIITHSSADWERDRTTGQWKRCKTEQTRGLNHNGHPLLKTIFKGAAKKVLQMPKHPLHEDYQRMIAAGTKPNLAELTIARRIAAVALAVWKNKEEYDPARHCSRPA